MNSTLTTWFWRGAIVTLLITLFSPKTQAQSKPRQFTSKYKTLGYRSCGLGQSACHGGNKPEGKWWKSDPHYGTLDDLKRKKARSQQIAQLYGMKPENYLRSNQRCADCHGQAVSRKKKMNAGVACEECHGPAGPEQGPNAGYFTVHQVGDLPADPLDTGRIGYQKALKVGLRKLRDVKVRAKLCVRCHLITEKKLLEAGHPSGEGFDYVNKGIKNSISKHWDYKPRAIDLDEKPYRTEENKSPVPQDIVLKSLGGAQPGQEIKTIYIRVGEEAPPWLQPDKTITLEPFEPNVTDSTSIDSILMMVKDRIELIHRKIRGKND